MAKTSSIFIEKLSVVDGAYIDHTGSIRGASYYPSFIVTGKVDETEQVVVDFSKIKNNIKKILDDFENGFDHKCWVIDGYSAVDVIGPSTSRPGLVELFTPSFGYVGPEHSFKFIDIGTNLTPFAILEAAMEAEVQAGLQKIYPDIDIKVECINSESNCIPESIDTFFPFSYTHGLPMSSSTKCRRAVHGHGSFIGLDFGMTPPIPNDGIVALKREICRRDIVFINKSRIVQAVSSDFVAVAYVDEGGETYYVEYDPKCHTLVYLDNDSTVENIVDLVVSMYGNDLRAAGVEKLFISEGRQKGAMCVL